LAFWHFALFHLHAWHPPPVLRNRVIVNFLRASGGKKALAGKTAFGKTAFGKTAFGKTAFGKTAFGKTALGKTAFGKIAFSMGKTGFDESGLLFTTNMRFPFVFVYAIMLCIHNKKNKNVKRINFFLWLILFLLVQQFA
jgi:hypothetical protein